ncbi:hypothetical protein QR680_006602 [Steinernema hermaphroditum]|uniref:Uncharacterized protein n=1 Tax=Steinernema hermaphroditum TaxID=289476 RepID=A0AA39LXP0_9BILA|nr:hypothetical protein QR680_006602 [Steinernema hermaphroditum]
MPSKTSAGLFCNVQTDLKVQFQRRQTNERIISLNTVSSRFIVDPNRSVGCRSRKTKMCCTKKKKCASRSIRKPTRSSVVSAKTVHSTPAWSVRSTQGATDSTPQPREQTNKTPVTAEPKHLDVPNNATSMPTQKGAPKKTPLVTKSEATQPTPTDIKDEEPEELIETGPPPPKDEPGSEDDTLHGVGTKMPNFGVDQTE